MMAPIRGKGKAWELYWFYVVKALSPSLIRPIFRQEWHNFSSVLCCQLPSLILPLKLIDDSYIV